MKVHNIDNYSINYIYTNRYSYFQSLLYYYKKKTYQKNAAKLTLFFANYKT